MVPAEVSALFLAADRILLPLPVTEISDNPRVFHRVQYRLKLLCYTNTDQLQDISSQPPCHVSRRLHSNIFLFQSIAATLKVMFY